jgi:hypothetical protein
MQRSCALVNTDVLQHHVYARYQPRPCWCLALSRFQQTIRKLVGVNIQIKDIMT